MLSRPYSLELRTALLSRTSFHVRGKLQRNRERITVHGLNDNDHKDLKNLFKSAAISASTVQVLCTTSMWLE